MSAPRRTRRPGTGARTLTAAEVRWTSGPVAASRRPPPPSQLLGQPRALAALRTGLELYAPGYNLFLSGLLGSGRTRIVRHLLEELVPACRLGPDRVLVHNFAEPNRPRLLTLPRGQAHRFRGEMVELIHELRESLRAALSGRSHRESRKLIRAEAEGRHQRLLRALRREARRQGCDIVEFNEEDGLRVEVLPVHDGGPIAVEAFEALCRERKIGEAAAARLRRARELLLERLEEMSEQMRRVYQRFDAELRRMDREVAERVAAEVLGNFAARWPHDGVAFHLDGIRQDLLDDLGRWVADEPRPAVADGLSVRSLNGRFRDLDVLVVRCQDGEHCPVVVESSPNYPNLFGTVERVADQPDSELRRIHPGSLLRADGGYLILRCADVIAEPGVWQQLKRALKTGTVEIREFDPSAATTAGSLQPDAIPIDVKVVMIGEPGTYELLAQDDPQFPHLFKVHAEFDEEVRNDAANRRRYADFVRWVAAGEGLTAFGPDAVGALCEHGARTAGRRDRLTTRFGELADVVREAAHLARAVGARTVGRTQVERALEQREYRVDLARDHVEQDLADGYTLLSTTGRAVGQVNALTVIDHGTFRFGRTVRVTATTGPTSERKADLLSIEREAELSGPLHDKGVLILHGFLLERFGQDGPIPLGATICFEQLYAGLDGDSASCAELFALLSSLSRVALDQGIAVTGSMNQRGEMQAVGGVVEKIEGFYRACRARRLTGRQGVLIPAANARDLMLAPEIVDAVRAGRFHVHVARDVLDGLALLAGRPAAEVLERARAALLRFRSQAEDEPTPAS
jgi:predicted ATP-dependent protease